MDAEENCTPEYTDAMDRAMHAGITRLREELASEGDVDAHLRHVRELADPHRIALEVGFGADIPA